MGKNGFIEHTLKNGLRVVIELMPHVCSAAAGFLVRTGARDETPDLAGVSHFLEHMCFKGTSKRDWRQITVDFDQLGSTYNAYTSKERTFYYGWVRVLEIEKQIELLADMMRSALPEAEFDMEKKVILEEIAMSDDQIDRQVYELIHEKVYPDHSLAWPVLGTAESVGRMTRGQMHDYFSKRYHAGNMILIIAGAIEASEAIAAAERVCGSWIGGPARPDRIKPRGIPDGMSVQPSDRFQQQAVAMIYPAPGSADPDRDTGNVVASILGGHNSRFFWKIVQEGIAPSVWAGRLDYCDQGLMAVCGFCEPDRCKPMIDAFEREISKLMADGATDDEVQRVKNRVRTGLALESESPYYRLSQMVQDVDVLGRPRPVAERLAAIDAVTPDSIREFLARWPMRGRGYLASVGPQGALQL